MKIKDLPTFPKTGDFAGIKGVHLNRVRFEFSQNSDSNQPGDEGQSLEVSTDDAGGGSYVIIKTDRWAMDREDLDKFAACLKKIVALPEEYTE